MSVLNNSFVLEINGIEWTNFNSFEIDLKYDSIGSTFTIESDYDVNNPMHRKLFSPLKYNRIQIFANVPVGASGTQTTKELVLTGTILNHSTSASKEKSLLGLSGYSITGVLEDCTIDVDSYPLQIDGMNLGEIVAKLIKPFGLGLYIADSINQNLVLGQTLEDPVSNTTPVTPDAPPLATNPDNQTIDTGRYKFTDPNYAPISDDANAKISKIDFKPSETIKEIITKLTSQRNVVLTHDRWGNVILTTLNTNTIVKATYDENENVQPGAPLSSPTTKISLNVNGQALHSKLSIVREASLESDEPGESTIDQLNTDQGSADSGFNFAQTVDPGILNNQIASDSANSEDTGKANIYDGLIYAYRPTMKELSTGENQTAELAVKMLMAAELKNIKLTIDTDRWTWLGPGTPREVIRPNNMISVLSPSNFIFKPTLFFVENVKLKGTTEEITASLECVLPQTFTGDTPSYILSK